MIDSHCHLGDIQFAADLPQVIERARNAGVFTMVTIADDLPEAKKCREIAHAHDEIYFTAGIHPHHAKNFRNESSLAEIKTFLEDPKCKAVGEIGLDYHYMNSPKDMQQRAFEAQLALAKDLNMPAVVHCRDAVEDIRTIVRHVKPLMLVIHCCTEKWEDISWAIDDGYLLSFTGIATYPKSTDIRETIKRCPLERMMIETDAPYLAPDIHRGKRNEPAFVTEVAKCIADVKGITLDEVEKTTTANTVAFYRLGS